MKNKERMPLLFVGHGTPMNAISNNHYSQEWQRIGKELQLLKPKAIICLSANLIVDDSFVTSQSKLKTIYDFYGFPEQLYHVLYDVAGDPKLAQSIHQLVPQIEPVTNWGVDHGSWIVLKNMFPKADIPVLQISIDYSKEPIVQFELLKKIRELRNQGILFIGSGNIVHNLQMASDRENAYDWAIEFENTCKKLIAKGDIESLINYQKLGESARMSIPTDDHYRPMLNTLALKFEDEEPTFFNQGIDLASVSMLSFIYR